MGNDLPRSVYARYCLDSRLLRSPLRERPPWEHKFRKLISDRPFVTSDQDGLLGLKEPAIDPFRGLVWSYKV